MKRSALIYLRSFHIGGAEKSNLRMMKRLVADGWEVELLLESSGGTLENQVPKAIKVNHLDRGLFLITKRDNQFTLSMKTLMRRVLRKIGANLYKARKYDLAVNGLGPDANIIGKYVRADVKLHWIRIDVDPLVKRGSSLNKQRNNAKYMDGFPCVSQAVYESLVSHAPDLAAKAFVLYNFFNSKEMLKKSEEIPNPYLGFTLDNCKVVTVCRIDDKQKGVFRMLDVYKRLHDEGIDFYWFIIGDGADLKELITRTKELGLHEGFILLGGKSNPFPYYRHADLCASLSYYEGFCGTIAEAKFMGKAVIATEFAGTHEQIQHLSNGYIVANNEDAIFEGMKKLLLNKELLASITNDVLPTVVSDEDFKAEQLYNKIDSLRMKKAQSRIIS